MTAAPHQLAGGAKRRAQGRDRLRFALACKPKSIRDFVRLGLYKDRSSVQRAFRLHPDLKLEYLQRR